MWAIEIDKNNGLYKLDSIPFYGPSIATKDEFKAVYQESDGILVYKETINYSGNSIVLVIIVEKGFNKEILREEFKAFSCSSEGLNDSYFSLEIEKDVDYLVIKNK